MIQLALNDFRADLSRPALEALKAEFAEFHTLQVRQFLDPALLAFLLDSIRPEDFVARPHGKIAMELAVTTKTHLGVQCLQLRMNDRKLGAFMEELTGITPIKHFEGRVYQMAPGSDHYDSWHDDVTEGRRVGVSINLSPVPYRGGTFSMRHFGSAEILRCMPNLGPGDAIFFRIDENLQHMVGKMEGTSSKIAFAGWFHDVTSLADFLRMPQKQTVSQDVP